MFEIARTLVQAGHETWCVGGAVRDALLGIEHLDWDLATAARPEQVRRIFRRTIPVGIQFGTVGVLDSTGRMHEVTTFRRDVKTDGRHAEVEFGVSLDDDLARRDFTINAIAWDPINERLHDPFDGVADLEAGVVRAVGDAESRFREDRLRALRAIRFASRFGFAVEPATWRGIAASAPMLGRLSAERVKQELDKTMEQVALPSTAFALWRSSGAFATLVPELADVTDHALRTIDGLPIPGGPNRPLRRPLRFAALFSEVPEERLRPLFKRLTLSNVEANAVHAIVSSWQRLRPLMEEALATGGAAAIPDRTVRQWAATVGRLRVGAVSRLAAASWWAARDVGLAEGTAVPAPRAWRRLHARLLQVAFRDPLEVGDLAIDGEELQRAGVAPGPALGQTLKALLEWVLDDPSRNSTAQLLAEVARRRTAR